MIAPRSALLPRPRAAEVLPAATGTSARRWIAVLTTLVGATAAAGPLTAMVSGGPGAVLTRFTVLANLLVAGAFGWSAVRSWRDGRPLPPMPAGGVLLLVTVTALMHHLILTNYGPGPPGGATTGLLLHTVTPAAVAAHWLLLTAPRTFRLAHIPLWLLPPLAYLGFTLLRGALLSPSSPDRYPYPFLDVDTYGYAGVLTQAMALGLLFAALGTLLTAADHLRPNALGWPRARRNRISPPAAGGLK
ncbi:Pr6Pr family membrane protein [Streptomyces sp. NPDC049916]|uniref:Pr6Pr family membrane protein n=1 Tax=Streptomyces sp. NPDC049916 TaxID=3155156 RepID=UPI003412F249